MKTLEKSRASLTAPDIRKTFKEEGCPYNLNRTTLQLHKDVESYLDRIGQQDGYWSDAGKQQIPALFPESEIASKLQQSLKPQWEARVHKDLVNTDLAAVDIVHMSRHFHFALSNGWELFPVMDFATQTTHWLICGMLFPDYDGTTEGWVVYLPADEVLKPQS
jgi:hypothetical protein